MSLWLRFGIVCIESALLTPPQVRLPVRLGRNPGGHRAVSPPRPAPGDKKKARPNQGEGRPGKARVVFAKPITLRGRVYSMWLLWFPGPLSARASPLPMGELWG
jgi:hypothetical protein